MGGAIGGIAMSDGLVKDEVLVFRGRSDGDVQEMLTRLRGQARALKGYFMRSANPQDRVFNRGMVGDRGLEPLTSTV